MDQISMKHVPEFQSNCPVMEQPDFAVLDWQLAQPDLMTIPESQLKLLMRCARQYDPRAIEAFATMAEPIIRYYSSLPGVVSVLGKEEARSTANYTMMDFLMHERLRDGSQDIPTMLKRAVSCDLKNQMERMVNRSHFEIYSRSGSNSTTGDEDEETDVFAILPADKRLEPESQALQEERKRLVQECLHYLSPKEKQVIYGFFFRQLSVKEIAVELHCTVASVSIAKSSALKKLRKLFEEKQVA